MLFNEKKSFRDFQIKEKALYFPYINVPSNNWFTQVLLYWDEIGSIVPREYIYKPESLDPYMVELVRAGLVKQIIPDIYSLEAGRNFSNSFINLVEKYGINRKARNSKFGPVYSSRIHIDKFGYEITQYLKEEKLAKRENDVWFRVENITAGLFMSYLATFLRNSESLNMQPITDDIGTFATFSDEFATGDFTQNYHLSRMRIDVLEEILPVPSYNHEVSSIAKFKEDYGELLPNFRKKIERKIQEISFIENVDESEFQLRVFKESIRQEVDELVAKMRERNWGGIVFGTVCGLGAAAIPGVKAIIEKDWVSSWEAIPGLLGAVYAAYSGFADKQKSIISSPLAYAAYVNREFH